MSDDLKSKLQLDASQVIAEAGKVEAALKKAEKAGNSTTSGMAKGLKDTTAEVDKHNVTVGKMVDKYRQLEGARKFFDKQPAALKDIDKQQVSILKNLEKQAKSEQELTKYMSARYALQEKMQQSAEKYSAHSQRQFGQLQGLAMLGGGMALSALGGLGRNIYNQGVGAYTALNDKYQINPALTQSQLNLQAARLNVGGSLAGYQGFKNNLQAKLLNSSIAGPLAMFGDLAGFGAQAGGGLLQAAGILKTLGLTGQSISGSAVGMGGKALTATPGLLGLLGPAGATYGAAAGLAGLTFGTAGLTAGLLTGSKNPIADVGNMFAQINPFSSDREKGAAAGKEMLNSPQIQARFAKLAPEQRKQQTADLDKELELYENLQAVRGDEKKFAEQLQKIKAYEKSQGRELTNDTIDKLKSASQTEQLIGSGDAISKAYGGKGAQGQGLANFQAYMQGPVGQVMLARMQNQRSDFMQDLGIQQQVAARQFGRGEQDLARSRQYTEEDYSVTLQKIQVNRQRAAEDYGLQLQRIDLQQFRTKRDLAIQETRFEQDQARQKRILNQDFAKEQARRDEDYTRQTARNNEDYQIQTYRVNQDYQIKTSRLVEDTTRDKLRADQDYSRSSVELSKNAARSMQDLNRNYHDSMLSILAPGLANSKMMQLFRLRRDYNTRAGRIGEDQQFARQGLDLSYSRSKEDIGRNYQRGMQDANLERDRAQADLDREKKRAEEDLAREKARAEADAVVNKARAEEQMSIEAVRQSEDNRKAATDAATDADLARRDASIAYTRAMQDAARDEADAARQHKRAIEENDIALQRLTEDYQTQVNEFAKALDRFNRDWDLTVKETSQNLSKEFGVAATDIETSLKTSLDGITGANAASIQAIKAAQASALAQIAGAKPNGSHAGGLDRVPFDGYTARLHKDEMVLTAGEAKALRGGDAIAAPGAPAPPRSRQQLISGWLEKERQKDILNMLSRYNPDVSLEDIRIITQPDGSWSYTVAWDKVDARTKAKQDATKVVAAPAPPTDQGSMDSYYAQFGMQQGAGYLPGHYAGAGGGMTGGYAPSAPSGGGGYAMTGGNVSVTIGQGAIQIGGGVNQNQVQQIVQKHLDSMKSELQQTTGKQINFASSAGF